MEELKRMEALIRTREDFVDFLSIQRRRRQLADYDARIVALQRAKRNLEETPLYRMKRDEYRDIPRFCKENDWGREDVASILERFLSKHPNPPKRRPQMSGIALGISKLGDALSIA